MPKTSVLSVAKKTLMVLGATYLMNCGSTVFATADADGPTFTEHVGTCNNDTLEGTSDTKWARITVPGSTREQLERSVVRLRIPEADQDNPTRGAYSIPHENFSIIRTGPDFDQSIWVLCESTDHPGNEFVAMVPDP